MTLFVRRKEFLSKDRLKYKFDAFQFGDSGSKYIELF